MSGLIHTESEFKERSTYMVTVLLQVSQSWACDIDFDKKNINNNNNMLKLFPTIQI